MFIEKKYKFKCIKCRTELIKYSNGTYYCPKCKMHKCGGVYEGELKE